ncbi:dihydrofolate reductase [Caulobacter flavus]|uniref:Dihydrofolate reductase n=1 Tax=Caulobacter flavus TaxID=1679497 RepID=A0A2N5CSP0_9CAUL|nr:2-hydroxyacid dehydrogenase [Caulobacter flavus]AYV45650.1 dihydrofolate reductase [Caulobacter flavus]PLR13895.1 dihydrofolate reductase [Caulobacter flavus]
MKPDVLQLKALSPRLEAGLEAAYTVHRPYRAADADALIAEVAPRIQAIVTGGDLGVPAALWDRLPGLEIVAVHGVGLDKVDLELAAARGVTVTTTPGVLTEDVAELAIGLWLSLARRMVSADRYVREGRWAKAERLPLARRASGRKVGILGLGQIGRAIAAMAAPFAGEIAYHSRRPVEDVPYAFHASPQDLARAVDVLFLAAPGDAAPLVDAAVLEALGPDGLLINVARGSVVDEAALVAALIDGTIAGAGLDVFADEPDAPQALLTMDNVVLQPHRGSATEEARSAMAALVLKNLERHFRG